MAADQDPITVVLAADNFLIGDGLAALLANRPEVEVVGRAFDHDELVDMVEELCPEAVLLTIRTPAITTMAIIKTARRLREEHPELGIVVIADRGNGFALELLRGGASRLAFLLDDHVPGLDTVIGALHDVRAGQTVLDPSIVDSLVEHRDGVAIDDLTTRELDVLEQMAYGLSNSAIATDLYVSVKAIEKNVTAIFRKLGLDDQTLVDRRVTAGLTFMRAQASSFTRHQAIPLEKS